MTQYMVFYMTKLSAKSSKDLERKAEQLEEHLSKHLKKKGLVSWIRRNNQQTNIKGYDRMILGFINSYWQGFITAICLMFIFYFGVFMGGVFSD